MTTEKLTAEEKVDLVDEYQRQNWCTTDIHKHPFGLKYTDGMFFIAETHQHLARFQVWEPRYLEEMEGWEISAWSDTPRLEPSNTGIGSTRLAYQAIGYSDFPQGMSPFTFWVEGDTALLKCEH